MSALLASLGADSRSSAPPAPTNLHPISRSSWSPMNIDFSHHAGFSAYVLLLMFSGVVMVFMASPVVRSESALLRLLNVTFGLGFIGYGCYLAFVFQGGTYIIFFKAFILPVLMII